MRSTLFIVNPISGGKGNRRLQKELQTWVTTNLSGASWQVTQGPGEATHLAQAAVRRRVGRIFCVGGDGTAHEILQAVAPLAKQQRPALGVLGGGTGADYARGLVEQFGKSKGWTWLSHPREVWVDFGKVVLRDPSQKDFTKYFLNVADVGLAGEVVHRVAQGGKKWGRWQYLVSALQTALSYRAPKVQMEGFIASGKKLPKVVPMLLAVVAKGRYFGGGMAIAPQARLDDGAFHVMVAGDFSYFQLLRQLPMLYLKRPIRHSKVFYGTSTHLRLTALEGTLPVDLDGEPFRAREVELDLCPKSLKILVPSGGAG